MPWAASSTSSPRRGQGPLERSRCAPRPARRAPATCRRASRSATTRRTSPSPITCARPTGSTSRPSATRTTARASAPSRCGPARRCCRGVTLDFTLRNSDKRPTATASAGPPATLATAIDDPLHARSPRAAGRRQPALGHVRRRAHARVPHQPQRHHHRRLRPLRSSRPSAATSARPTSSPTSRPIAWTCRRCG